MKLIINSKRLVRLIIKTGGPKWTFTRWPTFNYWFSSYEQIKKQPWLKNCDIAH